MRARATITVDAGSGDDVILAGAGNDSVDAGSGDDRIEGGAGDDVLTGGSGHDVFVFAAGFGKDMISDFKTTGHQLGRSGVLGHDVFADATAALAAAHQDGADVVFTIAPEHHPDAEERPARQPARLPLRLSGWSGASHRAKGRRREGALSPRGPVEEEN